MTARQETVALLSEIRAVCARRGIKPTRFGIYAARDPRLVPDMAKGRTLQPKTLARVWTRLAECDR